jgi:leader peptidase (prepilin peptidase)/N-methyltransferase
VWHPNRILVDVGTSGIFQLAAFVVGLLFGSFLNVCISRLPKGESIVRPRSRCPQCGASIRWYDNVPILSWVLLRSRCRDCKQPIPWRYPLVELLIGIWFARIGTQIWTYWHINLISNDDINYSASQSLFYSFDALGLAILGFLLIGLMVMDWQTMVLPDAFTLGGIAIGLFLICTQAIFLGPNEDQVLLTKHSLHLTSPGGVTDTGNVFLTGPESLIFGRIAAICGAALLLLLIRWLYKAIRHREGMGLGDVKLLAMIAAFLGFWPAVLSLFVGTLAAAFYGAFLLARGKAGAASKLAFGSFLCVGGLVAALYGNRLINMYIALLR